MLNTNIRPPKWGTLALMVVAIALAGASCQKTTSPKSENAMQPKEEAAAPALDSQTVVLNPQNNSVESGKAVFSQTDDGKTKVVMLLTGAPASPEQPAHIHMNSCADIGEVAYPLTSLTAGISETTIDVSLNDLWKRLPLAVNVHKSTEEASTYVSCGDLK